MDVRNSIVIIVVYSALAAILTLLVFTGYRAYVRPSVESGVAASLAESPRRPSARPSINNLVPERPPVSRRQSFEEAVQKIDQLKRALDKKNALLREKSRLLDQRTKEYEALSEEADQYFSLTIEMLGQDVGYDMPVGQVEQQERTAARRAEIQRLEQQLGRSDLADDTLETALDEASWQLDQAYAEMVDQQLSALLEDQLSIQAKTASVLVAVGAPAVPPLADALSDERADVRQWAATVLGQIGAHAIDATDVLATATEDEDESVRQAAREALAQIENAFQQ